MKPIPAPTSRDHGGSDSPPASASDLLKGSYSNANRRSADIAAQSTAQQAYPWLLLLSTAIAVFFAFLYITKPYVGATKGQDIGDTAETRSAAKQGNAKPGLLPDRNRLPGDGASDPATSQAVGSVQTPATPPVHSRFEETNMRVQHILTATTEDGHVSRIDLEVPVLYQSRSLRWSPKEVARARELLVELMDYQDKSRQLRSQGEGLLREWNELVGQSIPASRLRADSPSLPENQNAAKTSSTPIDTTTRDAVEIQTKEAP